MRTASRLAAALVGVALLVPGGAAGAATPPDGALAETEDVAELLGVDPAAGVPGLDWPNRRFAPCSAYDPRGGRWVVIGGRATDETTHYRDAWALELPRGRQSRWRLLASADAPGAPPPLRSCTAVYDPGGHRVLVVGGWDGVRQHAEVWALSLGATPRWSTVCAAGGCGGGPGARRAAQAVVDAPRERLVLFGGSDGTYRDDLWELSLDGEPAWRRVPTARGPAARAGHAMAAEGGRAWLFGGSAAGAERNDLWTLDLATLTWTEVLPDGCGPPCPAARGGASLVADRRNDRLVLFGGHDATASSYPEGVDLLHGLSGAPHWTSARLAGAELQPRAFHTATYDPRGERMLVFGGGFGTGTFKDTAALALPADGSAPSWQGAPPVTGITARDQAAVHLDAASSSLYAFGGFGSGGLPSRNTGGAHLADVQRLALPAPTAARPAPAWRNAAPLDGSAVPLHREATASASDTAGRRLFVVGGLQGDQSMADVWVAEFANGGQGGPREGSGSSADTGQAGSSVRPSWRQVCGETSCGPGPAARWGGHAVYDAAGDRLVVYGGRTSAGTTFGDAWTLSLGPNPRWAPLATRGARPPPRWGGAVAYDETRRRLVVWGGQAGTDAAAALDPGTWALSLDGAPVWTRLAPEGAAPAPRRSMAFAAAAAAGAGLLVFGGYDPTRAEHHNDVAWLRLDSEQGRWETLSPDDCGARTGPTCRRSSSAAHDPQGDRLLVVFGRDGESLFGDSYAFDLATATWSALAPAPAAS